MQPANTALATAIFISFALGWISRSFFMVKYYQKNGEYERHHKQLTPYGVQTIVEKVTPEKNRPLYTLLEDEYQNLFNKGECSPMKHPISILKMEQKHRHCKHHTH